MFSAGSKTHNGETDFKQFMQLRCQLNIAAEMFGREENLSSVLIPTMFKDVDEQFKLDHKVVEVIVQANKKPCVTLLRYKMDQPESSFAQVPRFARKEEDENSNRLLCEL